MKYLTREPISIHGVIASPVASGDSPRNDEQGFRTGASVLFLGIVRDHSNERKVLYLEYEAYEAMAERILETLIVAAPQQFKTEEIRLVHRLGRVNLGEIAVAIRVESAHRDEAYAASRYLIEEIKHKVPIWKKEYFSDGTSEWSQCPSVIARSRQSFVAETKQHASTRHSESREAGRRISDPSVASRPQDDGLPLPRNDWRRPC